MMKIVGFFFPIASRFVFVYMYKYMYIVLWHIENKK